MNHFINGTWATSNSSKSIAVSNPATGEVIDHVCDGDEVDADTAIRAADAAWHGWRKTPMAQRAKLQHAAATKMRECADELAHIITLELGRPLAASKTEIERSADLLDYYAEEGLRLRS